MRETDNCSGCPQHRDCKSMYQALGKADGSFVAIRSIAAFLLPILIFVLGLAVFDKLLVSIADESVRTLISALASLSVCLMFLITLKIVAKSSSSTECKEGTSKKY